MSTPAVEGAPASVTGLTVEEMTESLTGFEEIAITKAFGADISDLPGTMPLRALAFVHHKRADGSPDKDAYAVAMNLTLKTSMDYFETDDEVDPNEPVTPVGKGGSLND